MCLTTIYGPPGLAGLELRRWYIPIWYIPTHDVDKTDTFIKPERGQKYFGRNILATYSV
jgi:hypothetical protein